MKTTFVVISILLLVRGGYSAAVDSACTNASYAASTGANQCCPASNGQASADVPKGTGVKTCPAGTAGTVDQIVAPTHCSANYQLEASGCVACGDNNFAVEDATQATACTGCPAAQGRTGNTATCAACTGATSFSTNTIGAGCIACPAGHSCTATVKTACAQDQWSASGSGTCAAITAGVTGVANCRAYSEVGATNCAVAQEGFITVTTPSATAPVACVDGCGVCSAATAVGCTAAKAGWYINDSVPATPTIVACAEGCATCEFVITAPATTKAAKCLSSKPGWAITTANVLTQCEDGKGSAGGLATAGVACVACEGLCGHCTAPATCTTCKPGNAGTAVAPATTPATVTCAAFDQTKIHGSCGKAGSDKATECQECKTGDFRDLGMTGTVKNVIGECKCMAGYYDKSTTTPAPAVWVGICAKCPDNTLSCTAVNGVLTDVVCTDATFQKLNLMCVKKDKATVVDKAFWDATKSEFASCFKDCSKCTAATETSCTACLAAAATWKEPATSADAGWDTYLKGQWVLVAGKCVEKCPEGYTRKADKTGCEGGPAASGSGTAAATSASGVYAIFALVASLLIIF